jgi:nucleoside-diphosphate-sugar epimerase
LTAYRVTGGTGFIARRGLGVSAADRRLLSGAEVEITDSVLSKQVSALEQAGYVKVHKGFIGKRTRTWLSLTAVGRRRFDRHLAALRSIAG